MKRFFRLKHGAKRRGPLVNASVLRNTFERRAVMIGAVQGGISVLLAARMDYI